MHVPMRATACETTKVGAGLLPMAGVGGTGMACVGQHVALELLHLLKEAVRNCSCSCRLQGHASCPGHFGGTGF